MDIETNNKMDYIWKIGKGIKSVFIRDNNEEYSSNEEDNNEEDSINDNYEPDNSNVYVLVSYSVIRNFSELLRSLSVFNVEIISEIKVDGVVFKDTYDASEMVNKFKQIYSSSFCNQSETKKEGIDNIAVSIPLDNDLFTFGCFIPFREKGDYNGMNAKILAVNHFMNRFAYELQNMDEKFISDQNTGVFKSPKLPNFEYFIAAFFDFGNKRTYDNRITYLYVKNVGKMKYYYKRLVCNYFNH